MPPTGWAAGLVLCQEWCLRLSAAAVGRTLDADTAAGNAAAAVVAPETARAAEGPEEGAAEEDSAAAGAAAAAVEGRVDAVDAAAAGSAVLVAARVGRGCWGEEGLRKVVSWSP